MAVLQTAYTAALPSGYPGMVANGETSNRISRTIADSAGVGFGRAVFRASAPNSVTGTPSATGFLGITIANYAAPANMVTGVQDDIYPHGSTAGIMTLGVIHVQTSIAVARGDQAYVTSAGAFTNAASGNTILTGWVFDDTLSAAGLSRLARR